jgi:general secretion pathway protein G
MQKPKNVSQGNLFHSAFTMVELVFVIVILGILAAVAIPRMAATRTDAVISKGRADVASIRSAIINERQSRIITGDSSFIATGNGAGQIDNGGLFGGILTYSIKDEDKDGHWHRTASDVNKTTYTYKVSGTATTFTYTVTDGKFTCVADTNDCNDLVD